MPDSSHARRVAQAELFAALPPPWPHDPRPAIRSLLDARNEKLVVLDDDPTGTQTVHGVPVLTEWPVESLRAELANSLPCMYLLTNSRSLPLAEAQALNTEIGRHLVEAAKQAGRRLVVVSRSDSTLRGHFPGEVEALAEALGADFDGWLLIPFFEEGGRYTIDDIHYVAEGPWLVPAGETEFARDRAFGYRASNLRSWVEEKTRGRVPAGQVASISLEEVRSGGPEQVANRLSSLASGSVCIANAASTRDLEVVTQGLLQAEGRGKRFLYRTAASFVPVRAGLTPRPLLTEADLHLPESGGGLIVVGSHVPRTTDQVANLLAQGGVMSVEVSVDELLSDVHAADEIERVAREADGGLQRGEDVVLFTSRQLVTGADMATSLSIGRRISENLVAIVCAISTRPRYLLAKGGITSSDLATEALDVKRALVLGQILPGVPVWQLGPESRQAGLVYVVFPGNVGDSEALTKVVMALRTRTED